MIGLAVRGSSWALHNPPPRDVTGLDTVDDAVTAIARLVRGKETVRTECIYVRRGKCRCIIARLVVQHGLDIRWLHDWQTHSGRINADELGHDLGLPENVCTVMQSAQAAQDGGTLGEALAAARATAAALLQVV